MKKFLRNILIIILFCYLSLCSFLYFFQESILFHPEKLEKHHQFQLGANFEELNIKMEDGTMINAGLFKAQNPVGLVFYLHGNAGSLDSWASVAQTYNDLGYDVFLPDYRGFGKSEGTITSQEQLFSDIQTLYDEMKKRYSESSIVVLGYSIGTGPAAHVASTNNPKLLILQAPYYSLVDMMKQRFSFIPAFLMKYPMETNEYIRQCKMPVVDFHGDQDEVIGYEASARLKENFKKVDTLITLKGQGHNGMTDNPDYKSAINYVLNKGKIHITTFYPENGD